MQTGIKIKSPNTEKYFKYIVSEIAKHRPFQVDERVEVSIEEGKTPMPEFREIPMPPGRITHEARDKDGRVIGIGYTGFDPRKTIAIQIADEKDIYSSRIGALWDYTVNKLAGICRLHSGDFSDEPPLKATLYMTIVDPKRIDEEISSPDTILNLNNVGDLWREPKNKFCYAIGEKSIRHKVIRYLATKKGYQPTADIMSFVRAKNEQHIRGEIPKINQKAKALLRTKAGNLIEGRKGSGYKISPKYKINVIRT